LSAPLTPAFLLAAVSLACFALVGCQSDRDAIPPDGSMSDAPLHAGAGRDGLQGWNILSGEYAQPGDLDGISFEWDYFMVHAGDGSFTGSIGYLLANPRDAGGLGDLLPKGGNAAIAGLFRDGTRIAEYRNFGVDGTTASGTERAFHARDDASGQYARMTPRRADSAEDDDTLKLEGRTASFSWDLVVVQDWPALSSRDDIFAPVHGDDVGSLFDNESWNVDMLWPRTLVQGKVTRLDTGEQIAVDGHGYRENSWGRWAFNLGGWDFAVVSDKSAGVSWAWQSYHHRSTQLDFLDLGFVEDGAVRLEQFRAARGELGWSHASWTFDPHARLCVPLTTRVEAQNDRYRVEADLKLHDRQVPMLSEATSATKQYVIMIQFPMVEGRIIRLHDGVTVAAFRGQGGGEFSNAWSQAVSMTDAECGEWGKAYSSPMPSP